MLYLGKIEDFWEICLQGNADFILVGWVFILVPSDHFCLFLKSRKI